MSGLVPLSLDKRMFYILGLHRLVVLVRGKKYMLSRIKGGGGSVEDKIS